MESVRMVYSCNESADSFARSPQQIRIGTRIENGELFEERYEQAVFSEACFDFTTIERAKARFELTVNVCSCRFSFQGRWELLEFGMPRLFTFPQPVPTLGRTN